MSGHRVPKGWRVQLMLAQAQRDILEFQEDAGVFRPERCARQHKLQKSHILSSGHDHRPPQDVVLASRHVSRLHLPHAASIQQAQVH